MKRENYDVVVIGSGMGGLSAAALLSSGGYKTLVVERLPRIGGRYSTIEYKGFKLTTGAIEVEVGGIVEQVFAAVGAKFDVRLAPPLHYRVGGKDYELPQKGRLRTLISLACENEEEAQRVMKALKRGLSWQEPSDSISVREWVLQYTDNEMAHGIFDTIVSTLAAAHSYE